MKALTLLLFVTALAGVSTASGSTLELPKDLRTEYAANPIGLESLTPRLSWKLSSGQRNARQSAYQVVVASSPESLGRGEADLWDSGRVASDQSIQVPYGGKPLHSRQRAAWKVRVWDADGNPTEFSAPATWEMGLLNPSDWDAEWIGYPPAWNGRALYFRRQFEITKEVRSARAYTSGVGYYEFHLNGAKIGDSVLEPGLTDFSKRVLYATHDVTPRVLKGWNTVGIVAGNGWYGMPKVLLQLEVFYADGTSEKISTHGERSQVPPTARWRVTTGPILGNSVFEGETYDARLERPGWDQPGEAPGEKATVERPAWHGIVPVEAPGGVLVSRYNEPIRIVEEITPVSMTEPKPGVFVFDTGTNLAGWAALHVEGTRGQTVVLKFAESLFPDGTINQENLRAAPSTDYYTLKGEGREDWEPRFTYHGFRYVQVEGFPGMPGKESVVIKRVRSAAPANGTFECDVELVNRIQRLVWNTEASNLHDVPTDCPQRDERMGWMNDLTVRLEESLYNFDLSRFYSKFLDDVSDTQSPDGAITDTAPHKYGKRPADPVSASYVLMPWLLYQHYADTAAMAAHFDGCKAWVDFLASRTENNIVNYGYYGDWSPPAGFAVTGTARSKSTPVTLMSTGYLYLCSTLLADMAGVLGENADQRAYKALAERTYDAFNKEFWDEAAGGYGANNQACNSFALAMRLVPKARIARVVDNLARDVEEHDFHLTTGNLCTKYLLETLADNGHSDTAFRIVTQESYPSWGFMIANGATTLWERWEHLTSGGMNSHNHPMMGSVSTWLHKYLGGIRADPAAPGFKRFIVRPHPVDGLNWVRSSYDSMHGTIRSEWRKESGRFVLKVTVPANTSAIVQIPASLGASLTESGTDIGGAHVVGNHHVAVVGSGDYEFVVR